jgi:ATP-dependent DNA helicase RecQ
LERATSQESWNEIVTQLNNHDQQEIVHAKLEENQLILAGPGAGKTKVIIHRVAYLLRVEQVPNSKILVLTYNHNAAVSLHKRLVALIGKDAAFIRVNTFHGLALRLLGQSFDAELLEQKGFDSLIEDATKLLKGEVVELGLDEHHQRSSVLEGIEHILVDEYQDIDQTQYDFIAALSGKNLEADEKLSLMAVGDDDQSIYSFRDANVRFIQQFKDDYQATVRYLVQNYRSTHYIIDAANSLIAHNQDRMKCEHPIEINHARRIENHGGRMADIDPIHLGKVKVITCKNVYQQANEVFSQIRHIRKIDATVSFENIAILARYGIEKQELALVRSLLHEHKIPYQYSRTAEDSFNLYAVKEFIDFKKHLQENKCNLFSINDLLNNLPTEKNHWHQTLEDLLNDWLNQFGDEPMVAHRIEKLFDEYLFEQKRQTRFGKGILLSTVHGAKGEEYKYFFVMDGNWQLNEQSASKQEDERRLYYVSMTRAIDQLILFSRQDQQNPHIPLIEINQTVTLFSQSSDTQTSAIKFTTTGLKKLYLSYACHYPESHIIHQTLKNLDTTYEVELKEVNNGICIHYQGADIAKIAKPFSEEFRKLLTQTYQAKVIAMIHRQHDPDSEYEKNSKMESWWLPVIEIIH